jgi:alkylated DNA repair dioxygenase AlkB
MSSDELPPGLTIIEDWITRDEERGLIRSLKDGPWLTTLKRRVQHYGYPYHYGSRGVGNRLGDLPEWVGFVQDKMLDQGLIKKPLEQLIVNEYEPGQGIGRHVDSHDFGNTIISLSLGSQCHMIFRDRAGDGGVKEITLKSRSLLVMRDEARLKWTHEIPSRKSDKGVSRRTRVSLTFRYLEENDPIG